MRRERIAAATPDEAERTLLGRGWLVEQPPLLRREILSRGSLRRLPAGMPLFRAGDPPDGIYAVVKGQMKLVFILPDGREVVLWAAEPGFWFGARDLFLPQAARYAAAIAIGPTTLFHLPARACTEILANEPRYAANFASMISHHLLLALRYIAEVLSQPALTRVARMLALLGEAAGTDERGGYELKLSQQELAAMVNLSRVTAGKALQALQSEGLITLRYGRIAVLDTAKLALREA